MQERGQQAGTPKADRTAIEIAITAAILTVIVLAGVNSRTLMSSVNCRTPIVAAACAAFGHK
jgi:hypothetical protein